MTVLLESSLLDARRARVTRRDVDDSARTETDERATGRELHAIDERARAVGNVVDRAATFGHARERLRTNPEVTVVVGAERSRASLHCRQVVRHLARLHGRWGRRRRHALATVCANRHAVDDDDFLTTGTGGF